MKKDGLYYNKKGKLLSDDFQVLAIVQEYNDKKEPIWFSKVVECFDGKVTRTNISKAQDRLYDLGMIDCYYKKVGDKWTNCWFVSNEADGFINKVQGDLK